MFCLGSAAQNDVNKPEVTDTVSCDAVASDVPISQNSMFSMVQGFTHFGNNAPAVSEQTYPLGKGLFKQHHIEQALELCPHISNSKVSQSELLSGENIDEISDTGYGLNFGYSVPDFWEIL